MNWLKNAWYVAGFKDELDGGNVVARRFLDTPVVMLRHSNGSIAALEDVCPHRLMPISMGRRIGDELQCGYHGMRFDCSGKCTLAPGQEHIPSKAKLRRFPFEQKHGLLWIWLGDAGLADASLIPDIRWNEHAEWTASRGYHHLKCDFRLSVDNLMDLGHESWVHLRTIGQEEEECIPDFPVKVSERGEGLLYAHREMPDIVPPPFFSMVLNHKGRIHRWQTAISLAPSICMTDVGVYPVTSSPDKAFRMHVMHLLTPETESTAHYFWTVPRNLHLQDAALTEAIRKAISQTFDEDAVVLEIQQKQIEKYGGSIPNAAMKVDEAPIRARRMLQELIDRENEDPTFVYRPPLMIQDTTPELHMAA